MSLFADWLPGALPPWAAEALKQFPIAAILIVVGVLVVKYIIKEHAKHIASKDAEIQRLVVEKKELQVLFMKQLRSTENPADKKQGKK